MGGNSETGLGTEVLPRRRQGEETLGRQVKETLSRLPVGPTGMGERGYPPNGVFWSLTTGPASYETRSRMCISKTIKGFCKKFCYFWNKVYEKNVSDFYYFVNRTSSSSCVSRRPSKKFCSIPKFWCLSGCRRPPPSDGCPTSGSSTKRWRLQRVP